MTNKDKRADVLVLRGGNSSEREVSLNSGNNVYSALEKRENRFNPIDGEFSEPDEILDLVTDVDLIFNCLHGGIGENGTVQTLFELLEIPYTGTGPYGSALAMNKIRSKETMHRAGIDVPDYTQVDGKEGRIAPEKLQEKFDFPVIIKPISEGSSRGIRVIDSEDDLGEIVKKITEKYGDIFIEEFIPGKEITVGILKYEGDLHALPAVELNVKRENFFNYNAKYGHDETEFIVPARLNKSLTEKVKNLSIKAHQAHNCRDYSRVDFRVNREGKIFALELNTLPGMTNKSDLPYAASYEGISFGELVETMANSALEC